MAACVHPARRTLGRIAEAAAVLALAGLLLAVSVASGRAAQPAAWGFSLREAACAAGDKVLFGEVARPWGDVPPALWEKLRGLPLFPAPDRDGRSINVSRAKLAFFVAEALGEHAERCACGSGITVWRGGAVLTAAELTERVEQALRPRLAALPGRARLAGLSLPESIHLPQAPQSVGVEVVGPFAPGRISLKLTAKAGDGKAIRQFNAGALLEHWAAVACAGRPVNPGEPITPEMVSFKEKNLAYMAGKAWDGRSGTAGLWRVKRPVGTDQPFTMDNLEPVPVVGKGKKLTLIYNGKTVRLSAEAEALADGAPGQTIAVRNVHTGRTVQAVVMNEQTVEVRQ